MILFIENEKDLQDVMKYFNCTEEEVYDVLQMVCIDKQIYEVVLSIYNNIYLPEDDESTDTINSIYVCDKCERSVKSSNDLYLNRHKQRVCLNCLPE